MENKNELYETVEKIAKASVLLYAIFENDEMDLYEEPCMINKAKYSGFHKAIEILSDLKAKGKCDFEASDIRREYTFHTIYINWKLTDDFWVCIDSENKTEIKMLLQKALHLQSRISLWFFTRFFSHTLVFAEPIPPYLLQGFH